MDQNELKMKKDISKWMLHCVASECEQKAAKWQTILFSDEIDYAQTKADDNTYEWQEE